MRLWLALIALLTGLVAVPLGLSAAAPFTPRAVAGKWTGTWTNVTFKSTGPAFINATVVGKGARAKLRYRSDFGGNVFGCADPPAEGATLPRGRGVNHWNARGFSIKGHTKAFGDVNVVYRHKGRTFTGGGGNPPCNAGLTWRITGKFTGKKFQASVNITFPDGSKALSNVRLTRR
ncbi:MAG: hypothetical protein M3R70_05105 [Actinomycetota bacterium]|nr:hypothetical protein [Actinomycetota bacterium]